ncbi:hypothetical protein Tco_1383885 [Tanacetum coccineum]
MNSGGSPKGQDTIGGAPAQTKFERVLEKPNEPPLSEGHTSGSGKGRMEHQFKLTGNVPITPYDSPLPGGYTPGRDKVHTLFMDGTPMEINMLVDKKYPLINELLEKMLNLQLEAKEIFDHSIESKNHSRIWYFGSGPGKGVFERLDSQNPSTNHDRHPINKERGYLRFQDKESVIHEDNVTMENLYQEDHQEHEVNSPQTNTVTNAHHQENIASNSNGTTITRNESRALSANRKIRFNQRKLVFEIDDCAGRIVGDDSQTFITKGGCVVRECVVFYGRPWKKQPNLLKEDIVSKTTEHSDFKSTCPLLARSIKTQLASHHRTRQYILHKHYLKYPTKEEAMTHPPNGVKVAEWVLLCDRFGSEEFQIPPLIFGLKISATIKQNRACNEVLPTIGTKSVARRIHMKRKQGKEVTAIEGYKIAHWSKKKKAMINDKATEIWSDLQNEEASSSCTSAKIYIEKLGYIPGHIRGRSTSTKHVFETESIRMDLNSEKEKSKQLEKDHLELKENHLKLQKEHVSLTKK